MIVTNKELDIISKNLCLDRRKVASILSNCSTVGDLVQKDLGSKSKALEKRLKNSLISLLYTLKTKRETV